MIQGEGAPLLPLLLENPPPWGWAPSARACQGNLAAPFLRSRIRVCAKMTGKSIDEMVSFIGGEKER
ncbi:MAG: hypothetical protein FWF49_05945 [Oscillospiraceae bacterium]|nr:hypothetical protein [Oscillospiraceae bacterium]